MKTPKRWMAIPVALILLIGASCNRSQVLTTLTAVVSTAEIALPIVGAAAGVPPATIAAIDRYLQAVGKAAAAASEILAGAGSDAEKSVRIIQAFSVVASGCNCVGSGVPAQVASVINAVSQAVLNFLSQFPKPVQGARETTTPVAIEVKPGEVKELTELRKRSLAIVGAIEVKGK